MILIILLVLTVCYQCSRTLVVRGFDSCLLAFVSRGRCVSIRCCRMSDRRRRLVPRWSLFGIHFRGGVVQSAIAQSDASLHVRSCFAEISILGIAKSVLNSGVCHWGVDQLNCGHSVICLNDFG